MFPIRVDVLTDTDTDLEFISNQKPGFQFYSDTLKSRCKIVMVDGYRCILSLETNIVHELSDANCKGSFNVNHDREEITDFYKLLMETAQPGDNFLDKHGKLYIMTNDAALFRVQDSVLYYQQDLEEEGIRLYPETRLFKLTVDNSYDYQ